MQNISDIDDLVKLISKLPGLGPKSAKRIVLKLINNRDEIIKPMANTLAQVYKNVTRCNSCGSLKSNTEGCFNCENVKEKFPDNCIVGRDTLNGLLKPDINAYHEFISLMNIQRNDKVVFFEDTAENLVTAKSLGWITVLIGRKRPMVTDIDFGFTDINQALNYFHNCISKNKQ